VAIGVEAGEEGEEGGWWPEWGVEERWRVPRWATRTGARASPQSLGNIRVGEVTVVS